LTKKESVGSTTIDIGPRKKMKRVIGTNVGGAHGKARCTKESIGGIGIMATVIALNETVQSKRMTEKHTSIPTKRP
jgi:hypothetical protein